MNKKFILLSRVQVRVSIARIDNMLVTKKKISGLGVKNFF